MGMSTCGNRLPAGPGCPGRDSQGFTLMEVVIAISILAMVVTVVFSSFRVGLGAWRKGERDIEFYESMRAVCELLHREISSTYPYMITPGQLDTHKKFCAFFGEADSLTLVSAANIHKRCGGLSLIELWADSDRGLLMGEAPALFSSHDELRDLDLRGESHTTELCRTVRKIAFRYLEQKNPREEGEWLERWDPTTRGLKLPAVVEITMTFVDSREFESMQRTLVPVMTLLL